MPGPGSPAAYRSLSVPHNPPHPVWKNTASPGRTWWPVLARASSAPATVITSPGCMRPPPRVQPPPAGGRGHVQQQAASHHLGKGVDAEPVHAVILHDVGEVEPVIG